MKGVNSTCFGSTISIRSWSGGLVSSMDATMELMQTLLPLPVAPAIIMCGSPDRSIATDSPPASAPRAMGRPPLETIFRKSAESITSRIVTLLGAGVGTSRPSRASPGTGSKRRLGVLMARDKSFSRARML